jgi:hypothetical protein
LNTPIVKKGFHSTGADPNVDQQLNAIPHGIRYYKYILDYQ